MKEFLENAMGTLGGSFAIVFFAVGQLPGGTILMAMSSPTTPAQVSTATPKAIR